jgi:7-cyano-7-deazaguanine reductase
MAGFDRSKEVTLLGNQNTKYVYDYNPEILEKFSNKFPGKIYWVSFNCPEFTSLWPKTGQPDYATIYIQYIPDKWLVESKSLKLYLFSFRNHGDFHEDIVNIIADDLFKLLDPYYLEVYGEFYPRGGISIDPFAQRWRKGVDWVEELRKERFFHHRTIPFPRFSNNRG